ncbi:aspartate aminotransferase 1 [Actinidia rufa]|uniref:Aspartate aminotransferase n=1 Tax=Actinidia rufa TaxID=165716 RepID=A0A7J0DZ24_9ERIC|nr:aspartate aminotransferase 1 [Actinidia rufa]
MAMSRRVLSSSTAAAALGARSMSSWWQSVEPAAKDPILGVTEAFLADPSPDKVNVGVGAYRDDNGKPVVLECVREAERRIAGNANILILKVSYSQVNQHYSLPIRPFKMGFLPDGDKSFYASAYFSSSMLVWQEENHHSLHPQRRNFNGKDCLFQFKISLLSIIPTFGISIFRIAAVQALSGTGACRLFADFQKRFSPDSQIYIPVPTWANHHNIWRDAQGPSKNIPLLSSRVKRVGFFAALMDDIKNASKGSFFLLHACAHNPTGVDPSEEQWKEISYQFKVKDHFAFFDMAYQGFASGDPERDAKSIRIFLEDGHLIGCAQSYAKNMGLYGQRVGCLR